MTKTMFSIYLEIGYHPERSISKNGLSVLHYHTYDPSFLPILMNLSTTSIPDRIKKEMLLCLRKFLQ